MATEEKESGETSASATRSTFEQQLDQLNLKEELMVERVRGAAVDGDTKEIRGQAARGQQQGRNHQMFAVQRSPSRVTLSRKCILSGSPEGDWEGMVWLSALEQGQDCCCAKVYKTVPCALKQASLRKNVVGAQDADGV